MKKEMLILPSWKYNDAMLDYSEKVSLSRNVVCYVTLNKTFHAIMKQFTKRRINASKFFFMDAITPTVLKENPPKQCIYFASFTDLDGFADQLLNAVKLHKAGHVVFDSVSSFLVYNTDEAVLKFFNYVLSFLEELNVEITLVALSEDKDRSAIKQLKMRADHVENIWE